MFIFSPKSTAFALNGSEMGLEVAEGLRVGKALLQGKVTPVLGGLSVVKATHSLLTGMTEEPGASAVSMCGA